MVGLVVVTHGRLASVLLETAAQVCGPLEAAAALDVDAAEDPREISQRLVAAVAAVDTGDGVLILVDLVGGTPWNRSAALLNQAQVEVLAGVNLPMLIKFAALRGSAAPAELARTLARHAREHLEIASEALQRASRRSE